ncbi:hypothetical protein D3C87_1753430 [compost metagenome]
MGSNDYSIFTEMFIIEFLEAELFSVDNLKAIVSCFFYGIVVVSANPKYFINASLAKSGFDFFYRLHGSATRKAQINDPCSSAFIPLGRMK